MHTKQPMAERMTHSDQLRQGERKAAELAREHGTHLSQSAQALVEGYQTVGFPELFKDESASFREKFAQFLTNSLASAASEDEQNQAARLGLTLMNPEKKSPAELLNNLGDGDISRAQDIRFLTEQLVAFNKRMEIAHACTEKIQPDEIRNLFAGNPQLEQIFTTAGSDPNAIKAGLRGIFESAAGSNELTFQSMYQLLNRYANHQTAERRFMASSAESALREMTEKYNVDPMELRRQVDPNATRAQNIERMGAYLQDRGMSRIGSWFRAGRTERIARLVTYFTQNQEAELQQIASITNGLLSNDAVYAGAIDSMLKGTPASNASETLTSESTLTMKNSIDSAFDATNKTVGADLQTAYQEALQNAGLTSSTDSAFQRQFLGDYYSKHTRGVGFFKWLLNLLWGRQQENIMSNKALDGITA